MRVLVVGAGGMLGQDAVLGLQSAGHEVIGVDRDQVDITHDVGDIATGYEVVLNCAAWTAVDPAEDDEAGAFAVNATGAANLARAVSAAGARMVQISTDYVFHGDATAPYGEDDLMDPISAYGRTKAAGEWAVRFYNPESMVVRTAWLYGEFGNCFPKTMARLAGTHETLSVITDQVGQPTWTVDLVRLIIDLLEKDAPAGVYHGTSSGQVSWNGFTKAIVTSLGKDPAIVLPTTAAEFQRPAPRPAYSVLGHDALARAGVEPIGDWHERWLAAAPAVLGL